MDTKVVTFGGDVAVEALAQYARQYDFRLLLVPQTFDARLTAPRLAARIDAGVVMNGLALGAEGGEIAVTASAFGGDTRVVYVLAGAARYVVGMSTSALVVEPAPTPTTPPVRDVGLGLGGVEEQVRIVAQPRRPARIEKPPFWSPAAQLGKDNPPGPGLADGSAVARRRVDRRQGTESRRAGRALEGHTPAALHRRQHQRQANTGRYAAAKTLVAINRDPDAAIFLRALRHRRLSQILPALVRAVKAGRVLSEAFRSRLACSRKPRTVRA